MSDTNEETGEVAGALMRKEDQLAPAAAALQAQAVASVQARVLMAIKRPRDVAQFRLSLLKECKRPGWADAAIYSKPVSGSKIEGPSIRFAEAAARLFGNMLIESQVVSEDEDNRIVRVMATDLETNTTDYQDVVVARKVERKNPSGRDVLQSRRNSRGEQTYVVRATDDEMLTATNAAVSKMRRNKILALIPADIVEEAIEQCEVTLKDRDAKDPDGETKKLLTAFDVLGVAPAQLKEYLGHPPERLNPLELKDLRTIYQGIKQGETNWRAVIELKNPAQDKPETKKEHQGSKVERMEKELGKEPGADG